MTLSHVFKNHLYFLLENVGVICFSYWFTATAYILGNWSYELLVHLRGPQVSCRQKSKLHVYGLVVGGGGADSTQRVDTEQPPSGA